MSQISAMAENEIRAARTWVFAQVSLHPKTFTSISIAIGIVGTIAVQKLFGVI